MNERELTALALAFDNDAKLLYCLALRPTVDTHTGITEPVNYRHIINLLNGSQKTYYRGRQINQLIDQLKDVGLVKVPSNSTQQSYNDQRLVLLEVPVANNCLELYKETQAMSQCWQPDEVLVVEIAQLAGLINARYDDQDIGEFQAYWLGRPDKYFSRYQWTQKFVFHLKTKRTTKTTNVHIIGQQAVNKTAGISMSNNTQKLVEKYHGKTD